MDWTPASWPNWKADLYNRWPEPGQNMAGQSWSLEVPWGTVEKDGTFQGDTIFIRNQNRNEESGTVLR